MYAQVPCSGSKIVSAKYAPSSTTGIERNHKVEMAALSQE